MPSVNFTAMLVVLFFWFSPSIIALRTRVAYSDHDLRYEPVIHDCYGEQYSDDAVSHAGCGRHQSNDEYRFQSDFLSAYYPQYVGVTHAKLVKRDPMRLSSKPSPRKNKPDPKTQERDQKKADADALQRVRDDDKKTTSQAQSAIDDAHKKAQKKIDTLNDQQGYLQTSANRLRKEIDSAGKSRAEQNKVARKRIELINIQKKLGSGNLSSAKQQALQREVNQDMKTVSDANKKGNDAQHHEFNDDGKAKSDGQKQAEQALAGFLKFLQYFGEVVSDLSMLFPGGGELLGLGMKLAKVGVEAAEAAKVGGTIAKIGKAYKGADKLKKAGDNVNELRKMLGLKPGDQQIQGMNGKQMQQWQDYMIKKLLEQSSKNIAVDAKQVSDTNLKTAPRRSVRGGNRKPK